MLLHTLLVLILFQGSFLTRSQDFLMLLHPLLVLSSDFLSFEFLYRSLHNLISSLFAEILFVGIGFFIVILFNTFHKLCIFPCNYVPLIFFFSLLLLDESLLIVSIFTDVSFIGVVFSWLFNNNFFIGKFRFVLLGSPKINIFLSLFPKRSLCNMSCKLLRSIKLYLLSHFILANWWIGIFNQHIVDCSWECTCFWRWNETISWVTMLIMSFGTLVAGTIWLSWSFDPDKSIEVC